MRWHLRFVSPRALRAVSSDRPVTRGDPDPGSGKRGRPIRVIRRPVDRFPGGRPDTDQESFDPRRTGTGRCAGRLTDRRERLAADGTIVFGTADSGLKQISDGGGPITELTTLDPSLASGPRWPSAVSGSTIVLFAIPPAGGVPTATLAVVDVATVRMVVFRLREPRRIRLDRSHRVRSVRRSIYAAPFDLGELLVSGRRRSC